jgi:hypothetical protein
MGENNFVLDEVVALAGSSIAVGLHQITIIVRVVDGVGVIENRCVTLFGVIQNVTPIAEVAKAKQSNKTESEGGCKEELK